MSSIAMLRAHKGEKAHSWCPQRFPRTVKLTSLMKMFSVRCNYVRIAHWTHSNSSVGIATGSRLDGRGIEFKKSQEFSLHVLQTGSGVHPASFPKGTRGGGSPA